MIPDLVTTYRLAEISRVSRNVVFRMLELGKLKPLAYLRSGGSKAPLFSPESATDVFDFCEPSDVRLSKR